MQKVILILTLSMPLNLPRQMAIGEALCVNTKFVASEKNFFYHLGNRRISLQLLKYGKSNDIVMISLHDDELTSVRAAKNVLEKKGGVLIRIENDKKRYVTFSHKGQVFTFDPNRIFTKSGIRSNLEEQNISITNTAIKSVDGFAEFLLKKIPPARTLIALHNNADRGLSVHTYMKGGFHERNAVAVNKNDLHDPDNFFFTTDRRLSRSLGKVGYNVIYQNNKKAIDDGSLSIYYGRRSRSYINIEAQDGMLDAQERMIESVVRRVRNR